MASMTPERIVPIGVLVGHLTIQHGGDFKGFDTVKGRQANLHSRTIGGRHADEPLGLKFDHGAVFKLHDTRALEKAPTHVQHPLEFLNGLGAIQIQRRTIDHDVRTRPIRCVEHFGEVLRVTVFPPPHLGAVRIVHTTHVASEHVISRIPFFEIGALTESTVSKRKDALGAPHVAGIKSLFHDAPSIGLQVLVHGMVTVTGSTFKPTSKLSNRATARLSNRA